MPEQKHYIQKYTCVYCGAINEKKIFLSDLDFEGNYPSMRVGSQQSKTNLLKFTCKWCKRKNTVDKL